MCQGGTDAGGPGDEYFVFVDGGYLGSLLIGYSGLPKERDYTGVGRVRVAVERIEEG